MLNINLLNIYYNITIIIIIIYVKMLIKLNLKHTDIYLTIR